MKEIINSIKEEKRKLDDRGVLTVTEKRRKTQLKYVLEFFEESVVPHVSYNSAELISLLKDKTNRDWKISDGDLMCGRRYIYNFTVQHCWVNQITGHITLGQDMYGNYTDMTFDEFMYKINNGEFIC